MTITLEELHRRQDELAALISRFAEQTQVVRLLTLPETEIELRQGEHYAGAVLDDDGNVQYHLVLLPAKPDKRLTWQQALDWAEDVCGALPTRQEQALLLANCKGQMEAAWHWSAESYDGDASYAWYCGFYYGSQTSYHKSAELCARAVRRV